MSTVATRMFSINEVSPHAGKAIVRQFEAICRTILHGPDVAATPNYLRYITNEPHPFGNFAVVTDSTNLNHAKDAAKPLLSLSAPNAIIFGGAPSIVVERFVHEHGYVLAESMPAMAVTIESLVAPPLPRGFEFIEITSLDDDSKWCEAFAAGYGIPRRVADDFGPRMAGDVFKSRTIRYFAITSSNTIVCTSTIFLEGGMAGVYCVSTLPEHRGKGLAAHITAQPLRMMQSLGYQTGILQSSAMGETVYRRLGFQSFGAMPLFVKMPEGMTAAH